MNINYVAPPTVGAFMNSTAFVRVLLGPVGSGKTTGIIFEMLRRSMLQAKGSDGVRRTRWAIVRQTLSQLKMTVLLDVLYWLRPIATYKVSEQLITIRFNDVVSEWYLIPMEDPEDQKRLLSMQLTGSWVSEAIELNVDLVSAIAGRCGRFPSAADGGASWFGIIADTNAPVQGSDWYKILEEVRPADWQMFRQPSGLDAAAENLDWLTQTPESLKHPPGDPIRRAQGRTYYERLAKNPNRDWVRRYVHAEYGEDPGGTAVFRESFRINFHVWKRNQGEFEVVHGHPLLIGQDFGRNPCSLICQPDHRGRLLVHEEVVAEDIGLETHVLKSLKPRLFQERYIGRMMAAVGDPSGVARGPFLEENAFDVMIRLGVPAFPATTNDIDARIRSVEALLHQQRDGGPALVVNEERCPMTVRALNGAYRFAKTKAGTTKPLPDKNHPFSDLMDCLEAVCLVYNAGLTNYIVKKIRPRRTVPLVKNSVPASGWT
jgi:hypothetical protein